jgi:xylulokinase
MDNHAYLTYDIGTTALKTALVSEDGRIVAFHVEEYELLTPRSGWAEMPPSTYWDAAGDGTRAVMAAAGATPSSILGIGMSSQGETFIPLDAAGREQSNALVWLDQRAEGIADEWAGDWLSQELFRRTTGYPRIACELSSFKLGWWRRHVPASAETAHYVWLPDYLILRMTGELATDYTIALMSGVFDLRAQRYCERTLRAAGVDPAQLPPVYAPGTPVGSLTRGAADALGLAAGTPVCVGANDQLAGAVGAGNVRPGIVTETTGTALAAVATTAALLDAEGICVGRHPVPELAYAMAYANTAAVVLTWLRDLCAPGAGYADLMAEAEAVPLGCEGLCVSPHFFGMAAPIFNPAARGAMAGLSLGHGRGHLVRGVVESCACLLCECIEPMRAAGLARGRGESQGAGESEAFVPESIRSLGGAARSDFWLQVKADMLGVPVERPACLDAASVGAAALAAAGLGQVGGLAEVAESWYRTDRAFEPDTSRHAAYAEVYARYRDLCRRLYAG